MIRLYVPHDLAAGADLALDHGQSHYLASVMRQGIGDEVLLFNGRDGEWRCAVTVITKRAVGLKAVALERSQQGGPDLDLIIALVKRGRLETIVEKAAELGARRVRPVLTERTNADRARVERLTAIAADAAGDPALAGRTWVLLTEAPDGGWGLAGHANTNEELVAAARAQIASLAASEKTSG